MGTSNPTVRLRMGCHLTTKIILATLILMVTNAQECPRRCNSCRNRVVDCMSKSLIAPPRTYPVNTRVLNLQNNHIRILGMRTFSRLPHLEILKVNKNKINSVRHNAFVGFPRIATINLAENSITRISPQALRGMPNLRTLLLNRNRINNLNNIFNNLTTLYQLNLAKNRIHAISRNDLSGLTNLGIIDLRNNRITRIHPRAFESLPRLRYLFLEGNPINRRLPNLHFSSQVLRLADFTKCRLPSVPKTFPASLTDFRLDNNRIMQINYTDFTSITALQLLSLNDNELHFFADGSLTHLLNLREVWLRRNQLVYVPRDLPNNLHRLHMDANHIRQIEADLFSSESELDYLTVDNNQIHRLLPNTFTGMSYLTTLILNNNRIEVLETDAFKDMARLHTLKLNGNRLRRISQGAFQNLGNLTSLEMNLISQNDFQMDYNFLGQMPALRDLQMMGSPALAEAFIGMIDGLAPSAMVTLNSVVSVDLSYNTLEYISPKIRNVFPNIQSLPLDGNPFRCTRRLRWLKQWMLSSSVSFKKVDNLICESPPSLYGRQITSIQDHEWASDSTDRSLETLNARRVNQYAAMARDQPNSGDSIASSSRGDNNNSKDRRAGRTDQNSRSNVRKSGNPEEAGKVGRRPNLLRERASREERMKKRLRSRGRRRGKGKKNRRRRRKGKGRGNGGKGRKGGRKVKKNGKRKRDTDEIIRFKKMK